VKKNEYENHQERSKELINFISKNIKFKNKEISIHEDENFSQYELIINTDKDKKIIIHLALIKDSSDIKEKPEYHIEQVRNIYENLLISLLDNDIQFNHSL
jgi:hypothetical protein